jgi:hypothetical protein
VSIGSLGLSIIRKGVYGWEMWWKTVREWKKYCSPRTHATGIVKSGQEGHVAWNPSFLKQPTRGRNGNSVQVLKEKQNLLGPSFLNPVEGGYTPLRAVIWFAE